MARRASLLRAACTGVSVMTGRALLVALRRARLLLRVARGARGRESGPVRVRPVTVRAVGVARVRAHERLLARVTRPAEGGTVRRGREVVRRVARGACRAARVGRRVSGRDRPVAGGAFGRDLVWIAVRRMARRAHARRRDGAECCDCRVTRVDPTVAIAARRRGLRRRVRRMAAETLGVRRDRLRSERGLHAVAPDARRLGRDEVVRLVAREARIMVRGLRQAGGRVALRARGRRTSRRGVAGVTVETSLAVRVIGVGGRELLVAARAILWGDRRLLVGAMAVGTRRRRVDADRRVRPFGARVTRDARRRLLRGKRVTREAITGGLRIERMRVCLFGLVTPQAWRDPRVLEPDPLVVVALLARDGVLVDVGFVPGARAKLLPVRWTSSVGMPKPRFRMIWWMKKPTTAVIVSTVSTAAIAILLRVTCPSHGTCGTGDRAACPCCS